MSERNTSKKLQFTPRKSQTDWARVDAMQDEDIDLSEHPEMTPEMFANAVVRKGLKPLQKKQQVTLRLDADVLEWFRSLGKGYQTRINTLLRAYMVAEKENKISRGNSS